MAPEAENLTAGSEVFSCPSCGANLHFNPDVQALSCTYCGSVHEITPGSDEIREYDIEAGEALCSTDWQSSTRVIHCDNCGAETILEANNTAQYCAFCGSSHIVNINQVPGIKPESLVPFAVSAAKAKDLFAKWLKRRFFSPKSLQDQHKIGHLSGVYVPYWTFDSQTESSYQAEKGTHYYVNQTVMVTRNGQTRAETRSVRHTRWEHVRGSYSYFFDDVLVHGSEQSNTLLGRLATFNLKALVEYRPEYLSGFVAEKYRVGLKDGWELAKAKIKERINRGIIRQIRGDEVRNLRVRTAYENVTFKHILLPVWISAYTYKGNTYQFVINGQTGEIQGKAPVCIIKVTAAALFLLAIISAIIALQR